MRPINAEAIVDGMGHVFALALADASVRWHVVERG